MSTLKSSAAVSNAVKPTIVREGKIISAPEPVTQVAGTPATKRVSPLSLTEFMSKAQALPATIGTQSIALDPKQFSTGSFGYGFNGKVTIMVDGKPVTCQLGLNLTVVGSKEAPR
jgi:hypothetical protein